MERRDGFILLSLCVATFILFIPSVRFGFVQFDDPDYVYRNLRVLAGLSGSNIRWAFTTFMQAHWHPLTWLSLMLDAELFGRDAGGFHLMNVLWHTANTGVVFLLLRSMTGATWRSAFVAALFAFHPLHVESVAWIAERKDLLSTFFGLLALLAYARYGRVSSAGSFALTGGAFVLSLLAKPMLVTLPLVMLLLDYWPLNRFNGVSAKHLILEKLPLFALSGASAVMTMVAASSEIRDTPLALRLGNVSINYLLYILDMFWPVNLSVLYPFPEAASSVLIVLGATALLVLVTAIAIALGRRAPHVPVGWLWYVVTLLPVIGLVAAGEQLRADRYTYVPLIGLFVLIVWSLPSPTRAWQARSVTAGACVVLVVLGTLTSRQLQHWRNTRALFEHALSAVGSQPTLHLNFGAALADQNDLDGAIEHFREALRLRPDYALAMLNLGGALSRQEKLSEALEYYTRGLAIQPIHPRAQYNRGVLLMRLGRLAEAEDAFLTALRLSPQFAEAKHNLAHVRELQGKSP